MRKLLNNVSYKKDRKKRNLWLFDAGFHTLNLKPKEGEMDQEFVTRYLIKFLEGCRNRGGNKYKDYFIQHHKGDDYISVYSVANYKK